MINIHTPPGRDQHVDSPFLLSSTDIGTVQEAAVHQQLPDDPLAMKLDKLFYHLVKNGAFMLLAGYHFHPSVKKEIPAPVNVDQAEATILGCLPGGCVDQRAGKRNLRNAGCRGQKGKRHRQRITPQAQRRDAV